MGDDYATAPPPATESSESPSSGSAADADTTDIELHSPSRAATLRTVDVGEDIGTKEGKSSPRSRTFTDIAVSWIHLGLFGMLGCLLRIKMEVAVNGSSGAVGASDSALFNTLPGNMLGSFFIGALCTARALNRKTTHGYNPLAIFPRDAEWIQNNPPLQLGLRTGFCGALTTFASWNQQMVSMLLEGTCASIVGAIYGYAIGILLCVSAIQLGEHAAALVTDCYDPPKSRERRHSRSKSLDRWSETSDAFEELNIVEGSQHRKSLVNFEPDGASLVETGRSRRSTIKEKGAPIGLHGDSKIDKAQAAQYIVVFLFVAFFVTAAVYFGAFSATDAASKAWKMGGDVSRSRWLSLLLAPFGVVLRYELSTLNSRKPNFFMGTFIVNVLACVINGVVYGFRDGSYPRPDYRVNGGSGWGYIIPTAVGTGFSGCLSTVSTFMAELVKLSPYDPNNDAPVFAYQYSALTIGVSCALTLIIYGPLKTVEFST